MDYFATGSIQNLLSGLMKSLRCVCTAARKFGSRERRSWVKSAKPSHDISTTKMSQVLLDPQRKEAMTQSSRLAA
jgi:hypothetical protein